MHAYTYIYMYDKCYARSRQAYRPPNPLNMHPRLVQAIDQFDEYISAAGGLMGESAQPRNF